MGDFRKKYNCRLISRGKSLQGYTLYVGTIISCTGKKILLMMNTMLRKNLKLLYMYVGEKNQDVRILQKCKISRSHTP